MGREVKLHCTVPVGVKNWTVLSICLEKGCHGDQFLEWWGWESIVFVVLYSLIGFATRVRGREGNGVLCLPPQSVGASWYSLMIRYQVPCQHSVIESNFIIGLICLRVFMRDYSLSPRGRTPLSPLCLAPVLVLSRAETPPERLKRGSGDVVQFLGLH